VFALINVSAKLFLCHHSCLLYHVDSVGEFNECSKTDASSTEISETSVFGVKSLSPSSDVTLLYGVTSGTNLYTINVDDASATTHLAINNLRVMRVFFLAMAR
jgi:hypothetical protein